MTAGIPLVDLAASHRTIADSVRQGFDRVIGNTSFILGEDVALFEREFALFTGTAHCAGVSSGTDALELALRALGVGPGDEVILPANTFIATAQAVARTGARPVLVDCDPEDLLIDVEQVPRALSPRSKVILPVHLYGQMAPMEELQPIAREAGVRLLEDAAQAHGAKRHGKGVSTFGAAAAMSFYPGKNLGAYGDGGAVVTNEEEIHERVRLLRNHGSAVKYEHPEIGFNCRLDTLQAVVLRAKLTHLSEWNAARRAAARRYDLLLADLDLVEPPRTAPGNEHVYHLYVIRIPERDRVLERLHAKHIGAGIHYPKPIHLQGAFRDLGYRRGDFPVAEKAAGEILSLPIYPEITVEQQERVVQELVQAID